MALLRRDLRPASIESLPAAARREVEKFLEEHPLTPAGRLRPRMGRDGDSWVAVLGPSVSDGKVGFGPSPTCALQAFNRGFGRVSAGSPTHP